MQVVLLHRVENLGQMGEVVTVKPGYARNFLIPRKKALRATKENLAYFEAQRKVLETANQNSKKDAEAAAAKMTDVSVIIIRQAAESGKLYGSVSSRDVSDALTAKGYKAIRDQIELSKPIKDLGIFTAKITLHPEVVVTATVNVARTEQEAQLQVERAKAPKKKEVAEEQPEVEAVAAETATEEEAA
jgi:large subunit ribosomal protein L9